MIFLCGDFFFTNLDLKDSKGIFCHEFPTFQEIFLANFQKTFVSLRKFPQIGLGFKIFFGSQYCDE